MIRKKYKKFYTNAIQAQGTKNFFSLQHFLLNLLTHKLFMLLFLFECMQITIMTLRGTISGGRITKVVKNVVLERIVRNMC